MAQELPMPEPTVARRPFSTFSVISFDIYGTLIDWEGGLIGGMQPLVDRIPEGSKFATYRDGRQTEPGRKRLAAKFNEIEARLQAENPSTKYDELLEAGYLALAAELGIEVDDPVQKEARQFGAGVGTWPAFPDTVEACRRLSAHYKLIPLSNVDRQSFARTCAGPLKGVPFHAVYTAEDIGSYKPDLNNFRYLLDHVKSSTGTDPADVLHVAQSIFHDHIPAKRMGLSSVWIARKGAGMGGDNKTIEGHHARGEVGYGWRFRSLGEFADAVDRQRAEEEAKGT
jgi:2-haloalkanoic acid dehalogenase type II